MKEPETREPLKPNSTPPTHPSNAQQIGGTAFWVPAITTAGMAVALLSALLYFALFNNPFRSSQSEDSTSQPEGIAGQPEDIASQSRDVENQPDAIPDNGAQATPGLNLVKSLRESSPVWAVTTFARPEGQVLVMGGNADGDINIWDGLTGEILHPLTAHNDTVRTLAVSPSGQRLVSGSGDGIKVWQPQTGELLYSLPTEPGLPIWTVSISPDEQTFVSGDYGGNVTVWDLETGEQRYRKQIDVPVWSIAIAPDGESFVGGSSDKKVRQWDLETGELMQTLTGHDDAVRAVALSPDGDTLISGSWDSTIKVWTLENGELAATLAGHDDRVVSLAISPDGETLASSSIDSTLKLWDLPSRQLIKTLDNNDDWILTVAFDPMAQTLVSGSKDQKIKIWQ